MFPHPFRTSFADKLGLLTRRCCTAHLLAEAWTAGRASICWSLPTRSYRRRPCHAAHVCRCEPFLKKCAIGNLQRKGGYGRVLTARAGLHSSLRPAHASNWQRDRHNWDSLGGPGVTLEPPWAGRGNNCKATNRRHQRSILRTSELLPLCLIPPGLAAYFTLKRFG